MFPCLPNENATSRQNFFNCLFLFFAISWFQMRSNTFIARSTFFKGSFSHAPTSQSFQENLKLEHKEIFAKLRYIFFSLRVRLDWPLTQTHYWVNLCKTLSYIVLFCYKEVSLLPGFLTASKIILFLSILHKEGYQVLWCST